MAFIYNATELILHFLCGGNLCVSVPRKQCFFAFVDKHFVDVAEVQIVIAGFYGFIKRNLKGNAAILGNLNVCSLDTLQSNRGFCRLIFFAEMLDFFR